MKNVILFPLLLLVSSYTFSQGDFSLYRNNGNNLETNFYKKLSTNIKNDRSSYVGSPFMDDSLQLGTIVLNGKDVQTFYMRYNVLQQRIEFSETNDVESLKMLPQEERLIVKLNGKLYQYLSIQNLPEGYFEIVKTFDEDTLLLIKHEKNVILPQQKNSYVSTSQKAKIKTNKSIYFVDNNFSTEIENHKKRLIKKFPKEYQAELKSYINEKKMKFSDDYKGIIAVITKYLTLKN